MIAVDLLPIPFFVLCANRLSHVCDWTKRPRLFRRFFLQAVDAADDGQLRFSECLLVLFDCSHMAKLSTGFWHTCAIYANLSATCWGGNMYGQAPWLLMGPYTQLSAGFYSTCLLTPTGRFAFSYCISFDSPCVYLVQHILHWQDQ